MTKGKQLIETYFKQLNRLQEGDAAAIDDMLRLWSPDGALCYCGVPPITGEVRGPVGLRALFKAIAVGEAMDGAARVGARTKVVREQPVGDKIVVEWATEIRGPAEPMELAGTNTFLIRDGRIASVDIVITPQPGAIASFDAKDLDTRDIGRLALAAWAVV